VDVASTLLAAVVATPAALSITTLLRRSEPLAPAGLGTWVALAAGAGAACADRARGAIPQTMQ